MESTCPHCGASLPPTNDAFCADCLQPLEEPAAVEHQHIVGAEDPLRAPALPRPRIGIGWPRALGTIGAILGLLNGLRGLGRLQDDDPVYLFGYFMGSVLIAGLIGVVFGVLIGSSAD
jgi:hypothetical protein